MTPTEARRLEHELECSKLVMPNDGRFRRRLGRWQVPTGSLWRDLDPRVSYPEDAELEVLP